MSMYCFKFFVGTGKLITVDLKVYLGKRYLLGVNHSIYFERYRERPHEFTQAYVSMLGSLVDMCKENGYDFAATRLDLERDTVLEALEADPMRRLTRSENLSWVGGCKANRLIEDHRESNSPLSYNQQIASRLDLLGYRDRDWAVVNDHVLYMNTVSVPKTGIL